PRSDAASATHRYIAPESRYVNPSSSATPRATVDLPDPAGPSIATIVIRVSRDQRRDVVAEPRVRDRRGLHSHDLDALARSQPGDRPEQRQTVVAVGVDRSSAQPSP